MITEETLKTAVGEAERFLKRVEELRLEMSARASTSFHYHPVETAAVKRASMDLTRSLAQLRSRF